MVFVADFSLETTEIKLVTFLLTKAHVEGLDSLVEQGMYRSRSAAIRYAVMDMMKRDLWRQERFVSEGEVAAKKKDRARRPHVKPIPVKGYA